MKNFKHLCMISSAASLLGGCVSLLPDAPKPSDKLTLESSMIPEQGAHKKSDSVLAVAPPHSSDYRDTTRVVVFHEKSGALVQDYMIGTEWSDRLPLAFQSALIQSLESQQLFKGVIYQSEAIDSELILMTDIRRFDVVVNPQGSQELVVEITGNLLRSTGRQLMSQRNFSTKEALTEKNLKGLQGAYKLALTQILKDINGWVREKV